MKKVTMITLCAAAILPFAGHAQTSSTAAPDDLFAGTEIFAKNATNVTEISMDPNSLGMVHGRDKDAASRMLLNVVHTYEYDKPGMYNIADVEAFRKKLMTSDWFCAVHTRDMKSGESTDVCTKRRTDDLKETAIITVEPKELTFIHTIHRRAPETPGKNIGFSNLPAGLAPLVELSSLGDIITSEVTAGLASGGLTVQHSTKPDKELKKRDEKLQKQNKPAKDEPADKSAPADVR